ncbi:hypothetical protein ASF12_22935 [Paenibacillus sp. Leaf72]|nr:hypothetical protein ASF12_22935 [Paenibacillus sp. Leaf72]
MLVLWNMLGIISVVGFYCMNRYGCFADRGTSLFCASTAGLIFLVASFVFGWYDIELIFKLFRMRIVFD